MKSLDCRAVPLPSKFPATFLSELINTSLPSRYLSDHGFFICQILPWCLTRQLGHSIIFLHSILRWYVGNTCNVSRIALIDPQDQTRHIINAASPQHHGGASIALTDTHIIIFRRYSQQSVEQLIAVQAFTIPNG